MKNQACLFLIPIPIAEDALHTLSQEVITQTATLQYYVVENARTARRFLRSLHATLQLEEIQFLEIDKHKGVDKQAFKQWLQKGLQVGLMSEAGCPGIADPGAEIVAMAHSMNIAVVPLTGPSAILLALMSSGLSGQRFCFHGYLPVKEPARGEHIKHLEKQSGKENQTQICIETPYRNNNILADLLKNCSDQTQLCIAQNISGANPFIKTKSIAEWKKDKPVFEKAPAVFLFLA